VPEPVRVLVAEDEPLVRAGLREDLAAEPGLVIVGEARDGREAVEAIERLKPDLLLLDVQMPELDGFEVLEHVGVDAVPAVIFVTAHERYALRAFEAQAVDYLLKPFDRARLARALARAREWLARRPRGEGGRMLRRLLDRVRRERGLERLPVRHGGRIRLLPVAEIEWIEARGNYVHLHHPEGAFLLREPIGRLAGALAPAFVRVHRSAAVRVAAVVELTRVPGGDYELRLRSGARVVLARTRHAAFERAFAGGR